MASERTLERSVSSDIGHSLIAAALLACLVACSGVPRTLEKTGTDGLREDTPPVISETIRFGRAYLEVVTMPGEEAADASLGFLASEESEIWDEVVAIELQGSEGSIMAIDFSVDKGLPFRDWIVGALLVSLPSDGEPMTFNKATIWVASGQIIETEIGQITSPLHVAEEPMQIVDQYTAIGSDCGNMPVSLENTSSNEEWTLIDVVTSEPSPVQANWSFEEPQVIPPGGRLNGTLVTSCDLVEYGFISFVPKLILARSDGSELIQQLPSIQIGYMTIFPERLEQILNR